MYKPNDNISADLLRSKAKCRLKCIRKIVFDLNKIIHFEKKDMDARSGMVNKKRHCLSLRYSGHDQQTRTVADTDLLAVTNILLIKSLIWVSESFVYSIVETQIRYLLPTYRLKRTQLIEIVLNYTKIRNQLQSFIAAAKKLQTIQCSRPFAVKIFSLCSCQR